MLSLSRLQLFVYAVVGVVLILVGAGWIRSSDGDRGAVGVGDAVAFGSESVSGDGFEFAGSGGEAKLVVHVVGEVRRPGVYELKAGSRVADAIERAGGPTGKAAPSGVNLAARVSDGQQVVLPSRVVGQELVAGGGSATGAGSGPGPLSLATATVAELEGLDGIGPVTAAKIVEFRQQNGGIGSVEELDRIPGIGPATVESLRSQVQP